MYGDGRLDCASGGVILLYMCPRTTLCFLILLNMFPHATIYVSSYCYICMADSIALQVASEDHWPTLHALILVVSEMLVCVCLSVCLCVCGVRVCVCECVCVLAVILPEMCVSERKGVSVCVCV